MRSFSEEGNERVKGPRPSVVLPGTEASSPPSPTPEDRMPLDQMGQTHTSHTTTHVKDATAKTIVVVGIIVILTLLGWLGITIVRTVPDGATSFAAAVRSIFTREDIVVGINPDTLATQQTPTDVIVTWRHIDKNSDGFYAFRYDCRDGVRIQTSDTDTIFCGSAFRFEHTQNELTVAVTASTSVAEIAVPFHITFTPNNADEAVVSGEATLTVINPNFVEEEMTATTTEAVADNGTNDTESGTANNTNTTNTTLTTPLPPRTITVDTTPVSNPQGTPDLAISLLAIGTVDEDTGTFTQRSSPINIDELERDENVAVRFVVENLGDKTVEEWEFEARLPTRPRETFTARSRDTGELLPGTRTEFTLGFDRPRDGDVEVRIEVDHDDEVDEVSESNNVLVIPLTLTEN